MEIMQIGTGYNFTLTQNTSSAAKAAENSSNNSGSQNAKQIDAVEISEELKLGIVEVNGGKAPNISQAALNQVEMSIKLMQTMKAQGHSLMGLGANNDLESTLEALAKAYDTVHGTLNDSSANSEKHSKFLNDAFEDLARMAYVQKAERLGMDVTGYAKSVVIDGVNPFVASAQKQAEIFSDTFLKEYKKNGMDALTIAKDKLNNMPETTSLFNISYNDFKTLDAKRSQGMLLKKDVVEDLLKGNDLSGFMKDYLNKSFEYFKINGNSYGLNYIV